MIRHTGFGRILRNRLAICLAVSLIPPVAAAQTAPGNAPAEPGLFGPALQSLIVAQQEAIHSGNPDTALVYSRALAMASLRKLAAMDSKDDACRQAITSLPSSDRMVADLPTALLLLRAELTSGETAQAADLADHIVGTRPDSVPLRIQISKTMADNSDLDGAVQEANRAVEIDPNSRDAQIALGMAWWALNEFGYNEESLRAFTAAQRLDPSGYGSNLSLGMIQSQYHDFDAADQHLRAAATDNSSAPQPWYQLGMNSYEQDRLADAEQRLEQYLLLAKSRENAQPAQVRLALLTLDAIANEQGKPPDPAHAAEEETLRQQIGAQAQANTMAFSPDAARGAMAASARTPSPSGQKADDTSGIHATAQQVRELAANSLNDWGTALARRHEYAAAVVPFRYAAGEDPSLDPVMRNLGFSALMSHAYRESEEALRKWVAGHADDVTARAYLGLAQFANGEYAAAAATFKVVGPAVSSRPLMAATAAAAFARAGDRTGAAIALAELDGTASDPDARARAAAAQLDLGDVNRAAALAQSALAHDAQNSEALRVLGDIDLEKGNGVEAAKAFEQESKASTAASEEVAEARALLAEALLSTGRRSEAEAILREVMRTHPESGKALRSEGELLLKNGDVHAARERLGAALVLLPQDPELRRNFETAKQLTQAAHH